MIRSRLFGFASLAFVACLSVGALAYACVAEPVAAIARTIKAIFLNGFKLAAKDEGVGLGRPQVLFVQAPPSCSASPSASARRCLARGACARQPEPLTPDSRQR